MQTNAESYAARHWRGQLPLSVPFWISHLLIGGIAWLLLHFGLGFLIALLPAFVTAATHRKVALVVMIVGYSIAACVWLWQVVGLWRSARTMRHPRLLLACVLLILQTASCGGGGGSSPTSANLNGVWRVYFSGVIYSTNPSWFTVPVGSLITVKDGAVVSIKWAGTNQMVMLDENSLYVTYGREMEWYENDFSRPEFVFNYGWDDLALQGDGLIERWTFDEYDDGFLSFEVYFAIAEYGKPTEWIAGRIGIERVGNSQIGEFHWDDDALFTALATPLSPTVFQADLRALKTGKDTEPAVPSSAMTGSR